MTSQSVSSLSPAVLVVDDDVFLLTAISQTLTLNGYAPQTCSSPFEAITCVQNQQFSAVLADIRMPEMDGIALLERLLALDPELPVILVTGHGDINLAVEAMKKGAYHFLQKPVDEDLIITTLERAIERRQLVLEKQQLEKQLKESTSNRARFFGLVGSHQAMQELYHTIEIFGKVNDPVLIFGETGTGKELVAKALHAVGARGDGPYVAVNMGAIPSEMIEAELFGYEQGAFTGAVKTKLGKFEFAANGTLFLDEICSMPMELQSKLLRVLEEKKFTRLGSNESIPLTARIIAATNNDLEDEVEKGTFRQDLFFRLNVLPITLPPLRQRKEDIPLLIEHFRQEYCEAYPEHNADFSPETIRELCAREWPGNIRELRNVVRRYCVTGKAQKKLPATPSQAAAMIGSGVQQPLPLKEFMEQQEKYYVEKVLTETGGKVTLACNLMKISRKSLYDKINKYAIDLLELRKKAS